MRMISWNVNGLRACLGKGFIDSVCGLDADIICLQETKMEKGQAIVDLPGYTECWNSAEKKGYSGTAVFTKREFQAETLGMGSAPHDREGRMITLEFPEFYLVNVYTPNSQQGLVRLGYRMEWEEDFRKYVKKLDRKKPVIMCGDLNVAHEEIDIRNAKSNRKNAGFTDEERGKMSELLAAGFADTFREQHPGLEGAYSWWSFRGNARANNTGWRIDYFLVSKRLMPKVSATAIYADIQGSDHCPVGLDIDL